MKLHQLKIAKRQLPKRVGRGIGSGYGKTSGRGTKGQGARSGGLKGATFEGGQNALVHRLPKLRGFSARRKLVQLIHTDQLNRLPAGAKITRIDLIQAGLIVDSRAKVRLVKRGALTKKISLQVDGASAAAVEMIKHKGGSIEFAKAETPTPKRVKRS